MNTKGKIFFAHKIEDKIKRASWLFNDSFEDARRDFNGEMEQFRKGFRIFVKSAIEGHFGQIPLPYSLEFIQDLYEKSNFDWTCREKLLEFKNYYMSRMYGE